MSFMHVECASWVSREISQECTEQLREVCKGFKMAPGNSQSSCYSQWRSGSGQGEPRATSVWMESENITN